MPQYIFQKMSDNDVHGLRTEMYGTDGELRAVLSPDGHSYTFTNAQGHTARYIIAPASGVVRRIVYEPYNSTNDLWNDERTDAIMLKLNPVVDPNPSEGGARRQRTRRRKRRTAMRRRVKCRTKRTC